MKNPLTTEYARPLSTLFLVNPCGWILVGLIFLLDPAGPRIGMFTAAIALGAWLSNAIFEIPDLQTTLRRALIGLGAMAIFMALLQIMSAMATPIQLAAMIVISIFSLIQTAIADDWLSLRTKWQWP